MAVSKILCIKSCGSRYAGKHLRLALDYISNKEKTGGGTWEGCLNCLPGNIYGQMRQTKEQFGKTGQRQGYHIILSFVEGEVDAATAFEITGKFAKEYLGRDYETLYTVHDNTDHIHSHLIFNSVSFRTGNKYHYKKGDWEKEIQPLVNRLCKEYGLSTVEIPEEGRDSQKAARTGREWDVSKRGAFVWADMIKQDLDAAIAEASSYEVFLSILAGMGYGIKNAHPQEGKYLAVKPMGMAGYRRCKSFGEEYTREAVQKRIQKEKHLPPENSSQCQPGQETEVHAVDDKAQHGEKAGLSGIQHYYFARFHRLEVLKKRPYSQAWQYREDILRMKELQEDYLFLCRHNIHTEKDMEDTAGKIAEDKKRISREKSQVYRERAKVKPLFDIAAEMESLQAGENCFQRGESTFQEEHMRYGELAGQLQKAGHTLEEAGQMKEEFQKKLSLVQQKEKETAREGRIAARILEEIKSKKQERERQDVPEKQDKVQEKTEPGGSR